MSDAVFAMASDVPGMSLNLVSEFEPVVSVSADVAAGLPEGKPIAAAVSAVASILPGRGWTVAGYQHDRGDHGVGLALSLSTRSKTFVGETTLWEQDWAPTFDPKATTPTNDSYLCLAIPAAAWVMFRIQQEDDVRRLGTIWRRTKRAVTGRIQIAPATRSWTSYARFSLGVVQERAEQFVKARRLYEEALGADSHNRAALYNLAALDVQAQRYVAANRRLDRLHALLITPEGRERVRWDRDPLWYRTQYMRAISRLHAEKKGGTAPATAPTADGLQTTREILLDLLLVVEDSLLRPRKPLAKVQAFVSRPALRQDRAFKRMLQEFEGPALIACAGALLGVDPDPPRPPGLPPVPRDVLRSKLQEVRDNPENHDLRVQVAGTIVDFVFGETVYRSERFMYNFACYLVQHGGNQQEVLDILGEVLAGSRERASWAATDPSLDPMRGDTQIGRTLAAMIADASAAAAELPEVPTPALPTHVWYATYGSNLHTERFMLYLNGGDYLGRNYQSRIGGDPETVPESREITIPHPLYFGLVKRSGTDLSRTFVESDMPGETPGKAYRLTIDQFKWVAWQENGGKTPNVSLSGSSFSTASLIRDSGPYSWMLTLPSLGDEVPVVTLTSKSRREWRQPEKEYVDTIRLGIKETKPAITDAELSRLIQDATERYQQPAD
jgi:tetratricopeptide (TPR) repeat protein